MAENEVKKEKAKVEINIWFILFIVYLVLSLVYIYKQHQEIIHLNTELTNAVNQSKNMHNDLMNDLKSIVNKYSDYLQVGNPSEDQNDVVVTPTVSNGTYTGTALTSENGVNLSMVLTLSDNSVATLSLTNESGEVMHNGVYAVSENTVSFNSDDSTVAYSFVIVDENNLKLVDDTTDLTLSK